jgi:DNA-binding MarR family transcriptional regulator
MKEILKLDNQLCFQLYTSSRLMTRLYKPLLDPHHITYPQYLVLLVLFETEGMTVKALGKKLLLDSGTLTPLLKRMEKSGIVTRNRSETDERQVIVNLTEYGLDLEQKLECVPLALSQAYEIDLDEITRLRETLKKLNKRLT